ncbi:hypothetical protein [Hyphomicrobium facile]|uniref:HdeA/HdeB family protein n=1 Tax=Hyphomicrobium facile TaxID=51670 RepID=A0A1I7NW54_9HYPH|nr:hypothetical protein [Hyphomicrobium facile]SFV38891.1 hypothetical protein SAMN04488557_3907 [Hyphomicrobium facile]
MLLPFRHAVALALAPLFCAPIGASFSAWATQPKVDPETCTALRLEQIKFRASGVLDDMSKGPQWAKANLPAERLREIEHFIQLDEQVKFGCRDAKLSAEAERASEAAARIELNSDADPTVPVANDPPKPGSEKAGPQKSASPAKKDALQKEGAQKDGPKKATHKKAKPSEPKAENDNPSKPGPAKPAKSKISQETPAPAPPVIVHDAYRGDPRPAETASESHPSFVPETSLPSFGFGETVVLPHSGP